MCSLQSAKAAQNDEEKNIHPADIMIQTSGGKKLGLLTPKDTKAASQLTSVVNVAHCFVRCEKPDAAFGVVVELDLQSSCEHVCLNVH